MALAVEKVGLHTSAVLCLVWFAKQQSPHDEEPDLEHFGSHLAVFRWMLLWLEEGQVAWLQPLPSRGVLQPLAFQTASDQCNNLWALQDMANVIVDLHT
jgi:hypothetical protein